MQNLRGRCPEWAHRAMAIELARQPCAFACYTTQVCITNGEPIHRWCPACYARLWIRQNANKPMNSCPIF